MDNHPICGDCAEKVVSNCHRGVATMEPCRLIQYREAYDALRAEANGLRAALERFLTFHSGHVHIGEVAAMVEQGRNAIEGDDKC